MFTFSWPIAFLLFPLFWLVKKYVPIDKNNEVMLRVPFIMRIEALHTFSSSTLFSFHLNHFLSFFAWVLFVFAVANPQWLGEPLPIKQDGRNIMLAIDLSESMSISDLRRGNEMNNRLQTVKTVANDFIEKRQGDKIGLILFGSKAYLQTPLTFDHKTVRTMLDDATIGLAGQQTAIGDAIALAIKKLSTENIKSRILILLTDGANNSGDIEPLAAANFAKKNQIKIYTVGLGASQVMINSIFGKQSINPSAQLDEALLKKISDTTEGQYFRAQDEKSLIEILDAINQLEPVLAETKTARPITALFYWPLALSLLFFSLLIFPNTVRHS